MKSKVECVALLIAFGLLEGSAFSQKPAAQQNLTVVVVNAHVQPSQPVQSLRVSLSYLDGDSRITDARDLTNSHGQALLHVSEDAAARGDIRIEITGATDLVIYQPADGQLSAVPSTVTIQLLPKGSPALLGPAQIEAILHRSLLQVGSLQQKNRLLKQEIAQGANQKQGLDDALAAWAKANGFDSTEVDQHVQEWAKEIQARAERASVQQKALAELALKHYGAAGQLFEKAEYASTDADPEEEEMMKRVRARSGSVLRNASQAAAVSMMRPTSGSSSRTPVWTSCRCRAAASSTTPANRRSGTRPTRIPGAAATNACRPITPMPAVLSDATLRPPRGCARRCVRRAP